MNSLSWILYFGDVACNVSTVLCIGAFLTLIVTLFSGFDCDFDRDYRARARKFVASALAALLLASLFPDKSTVYAIAASEYGEEALKTPEASKARAALNAWLDKQIHDAKPEK